MKKIFFHLAAVLLVVACTLIVIIISSSAHGFIKYLTYTPFLLLDKAGYIGTPMFVTAYVALHHGVVGGKSVKRIYVEVIAIHTAVFVTAWVAILLFNFHYSLPAIMLCMIAVASGITSIVFVRFSCTRKYTSNFI